MKARATLSSLAALLAAALMAAGGAEKSVADARESGRSAAISAASTLLADVAEVAEQGNSGASKFLNAAELELEQQTARAVQETEQPAVDVSFQPDNILKILHNGARIQGGNQFTFPGNPTRLEYDNFGGINDFTSSDAGQYYVGLLSAVVFMGITLVVWFVLLATSCCCKHCWPCCNDPCLTVILVIAIIASTIGWFYSIKGNAELQEGLRQSLDSGNDVSLTIDAAVFQIDAISSLETEINNNILQVNVTCEDFIPPESGVSTDQISTGGQFAASVRGPRDSMSDTSKQMQDTIDTIKPILDRIGPIYSGITATIITVLAIFALTTALKVLAERDMLNCEKNLISKVNGFINSVGVIIMFTVGFLLVVTVWILAMILSPIALVGADMCVPDFSTNLLSNLSPFVLDDPNAEISDLCFLDTSNVDELSDAEKAGNLICYYANCQGESFIFAELGIEDVSNAADLANAANDVVKQAVEVLDSIKEIVEDQGINTGDCIDSIDALAGDLTGVNDAFLAIIALMDCPQLTPIYRKLTDDGVCNGIVSGIGIIFVTWTTGAAGMMLAMYMFLLLDPNRNVPKPTDRIILATVTTTDGANPAMQNQDGMVQWAQEVREAQPVSPDMAKRDVEEERAQQEAKKQEYLNTSEGHLPSF